MDFGENVKKVFLAGVGAVASTAEKSKELIDTLVDKGELTVAQGKVFNEELKRNINTTINNATSSDQPAKAKVDYDSMVENLDKLSDEELKELKDKLNNME